MFYSTTNSCKLTFRLLSSSFAFRAAALFTGILAPGFFEQHAQRHGVRFGQGQGDTYNAPVTLWAWVGSILSGHKSCLAAVARVVSLFTSFSLPRPSSNNGAYCKARRKLPHALLEDMTTDLGEQMDRRVPSAWRWHGHPVKITDGTTVQLMDTQQTLDKYPQQKKQKEGTSSTCMRLVALVSLASAALLGAAEGPYKGKGSGEFSLFATLLKKLRQGDLLLGDRYYGSYALLAWLLLHGVAGCFRLPSARLAQFSKGQCLGKDDYLQIWSKPKDKPKWLSAEQWNSLPQSIEVRLVHIKVARKGFRTRQLHLVTTLTDPQRYPLIELASLYRERWNVELDLRSIKQGLGMKALSCKTPEMIKAELWAHLLTYNLVRCVLAQAALEKGLQARQLSFRACRDTLEAFRGDLVRQAGQDGEVSAEFAAALMEALSRHRVGKRPNRWEPREIKKRQRKYPELQKSRSERRQELETPPEEKEERRKRSRPSRH